MVISTVSRFDSWSLRKQLCAYLNLPTGSVREDWPGGPTDGSNTAATAVPGWVTLARVSTIPQGPATSEFRGQSERERIKSSTLDTWRFSAIGNFRAQGFEHAFDFACYAAAIVQGERGMALFRQLRAGLVSIGYTQNLSGLAGAEEERAMFEFVLSFDSFYETELEAIRLADITVHYEPHGKEFIHVTPPPDEATPAKT